MHSPARLLGCSSIGNSRRSRSPAASASRGSAWHGSWTRHWPTASSGSSSATPRPQIATLAWHWNSDFASTAVSWPPTRTTRTAQRRSSRQSSSMDSWRAGSRSAWPGAPRWRGSWRRCRLARTRPSTSSSWPGTQPRWVSGPRRATRRDSLPSALVDGRMPCTRRRLSRAAACGLRSRASPRSRIRSRGSIGSRWRSSASAPSPPMSAMRRRCLRRR